MLLQEIKRAVNRAQHTQRKTVDFKQSKNVDIGFIPLDDGALRHGSIFDRHQVAQRFLRNHKSSGMLRQMTGKADQLLYKFEHLKKERGFGVKTDLPYPLGNDLIVLPPDTVSSEAFNLVL